MKILGFNITRNQPALARKSAPEFPLSDLNLAWLSAGREQSASLSNAYEQVVWVYRAVNVLAEQVANIPFLCSAGQRGRENLITSGPLVDFYERPHPHMNRFQYWELRVLWLMLRGECFRIPIYDSSSSSFSSSSSILSGQSKIKNQQSKLKQGLRCRRFRQRRPGLHLHRSSQRRPASFARALHLPHGGLAFS